MKFLIFITSLTVSFSGAYAQLESKKAGHSIPYTENYQHTAKPDIKNPSGPQEYSYLILVGPSLNAVAGLGLLALTCYKFDMRQKLVHFISSSLAALSVMKLPLMPLEASDYTAVDVESSSVSVQASDASLI